MATTDILPFATASGANVESQATYAGLTSTSQGFSAGTAASAQVNKVLRQSSFITSGLANYLVGLGISVPDDGNLANLVAKLVTGIAGTASLVTNGYQKFPSGLVVQWGTVSGVVGSSTVTFPIAFPTACFLVIPTALGTNTSNVDVAEVLSFSATQTTIQISQASGSTESGTFYFIALGY